MFVRRLKASLKEQHWMTIAIELVIVIIGVFVGNQVSNWNEDRLQKRETERMLEQLRPELAGKLKFFASVRAYYGTTRHYAEQALAGWRHDPNVTDAQFIIASYQASQTYGINIDPQNWAISFGTDRLRHIEDVKLRRSLTSVLTANYQQVGFDSVATPYREHIRELIPISIQDQIRTQCGDRDFFQEGGFLISILPAQCTTRFDRAVAAQAASKLRAHPEMADELNYQLAANATYLNIAEGLEHNMQTLQQLLAQRSASQ